MDNRFRAVATFATIHHNGPERATRRDAERDAAAYIEAGARVVLLVEHIDGFWMIRQAADIIAPESAHARMRAIGQLG